MKKLCTADQMHHMDQTAMYGKYKIAPVVLMENAGHAVVEKAKDLIISWHNKRVIVFCGKGNNGGDGFVIARHILAEGARVFVYVLGKDASYSTEANYHLQTLYAMAEEGSCVIENYAEGNEDNQRLHQRLKETDIIVDAIVGTGFHGQLHNPAAFLVRCINDAAKNGKIKVIAVDIPTGVNTDTGEISGNGEEHTGEPIYADMTVTFGALKRGMQFYPGKKCCGSIVWDPIGMPVSLLRNREQNTAYLLETADIERVLCPRAPDSHKGTHGTIAVVSGSRDMIGAPLMTCRGAMRAGAGKIFLRVPEQTASYCIGKLPEIMVRGIGSGSEFSENDVFQILEEAKKWTVIAIGPGMGKNSKTKTFIQEVIRNTTCPIVIDADALNLIHSEKKFISPYGKRIIMTPHLAEFSRLSGVSIAEVKKDVIEAAKHFVHEWNVTLVLKGAPTVIVSSDAQTVYVNPTGNAGMAAGGMGDVLTGMIAAFAAHDGMPDLCAAACSGVFIHGAAGDYCYNKYGPYGYSPCEVADAIPRVIKALEIAGDTASEDRNLFGMMESI